jgi:hypothetical protein
VKLALCYIALNALMILYLWAVYNISYWSLFMKDDDLIPNGWRKVESGPALPGDKYWSAKHLAWLPVIVGDRKQVTDWPAVIRRGE